MKRLSTVLSNLLDRFVYKGALPLGFDRKSYLKLNPDVIGKMSPELHYLRFGKGEGRLYQMPDIKILGKLSSNCNLETILIVIHEASRTGGPILALNIAEQLKHRFNVITLILKEGSIFEYFCDVSTVVNFPEAIKNSKIATDFYINELCRRFSFKFAIVNSVESRYVLPALAASQVPTISLIHEFASYTRPRTAFRDVFQMSDEVVFSTKITFENAVSECPQLNENNIRILPQGQCVVPSDGFTEEQIQEEYARIRNLTRPKSNGNDAFVILGAGSVQLRKGVDLFIECAAKVRKQPGGEKCHFVWVGKGYDPENDVGYSVYLADQLLRSNLQDYVSFIDETFAIEAAYAAADLFLLSSRLDPLPNVAIDALVHGLPVLCFDKTTGITDFLERAGLANHCIADYLDTDGMARNILELVGSKGLRDSVSKKSQLISTEYFSMGKYVQQLEELALTTCSRVNQHRLDMQVSLGSDLIKAAI